MGDRDKEPLDPTLDSFTDTGTGSGLTGGPNPGEPGHDGETGDAGDLGEPRYSPEMGSVIVERRPESDEP